MHYIIFNIYNFVVYCSIEKILIMSFYFEGNFHYILYCYSLGNMIIMLFNVFSFDINHLLYLTITNILKIVYHCPHHYFLSASFSFFLSSFSFSPFLDPTLLCDARLWSLSLFHMLLLLFCSYIINE